MQKKEKKQRIAASMLGCSKEHLHICLFSCFSFSAWAVLVDNRTHSRKLAVWKSNPIQINPDNARLAAAPSIFSCLSVSWLFFPYVRGAQKRKRGGWQQSLWPAANQLPSTFLPHVPLLAPATFPHLSFLLLQ
ncbi:hypothetical protein BX070DRAFT_79643 [Coemansia spiralis]|nr:hypothetical protein BX070DRAFT_79643 [Coemansia spiralis]